MPWPSTIPKTGLDGAKDSPAGQGRADLVGYIDAVNAIIAARGADDGIASLDANRRLPGDQYPITGGMRQGDATIVTAGSEWKVATGRGIASQFTPARFLTKAPEDFVYLTQIGLDDADGNYLRTQSYSIPVDDTILTGDYLDLLYDDQYAGPHYRSMRTRPQRLAARVALSADFTVTSGSYQRIPFDTVEYDTYSWWDAVNDRFRRTYNQRGYRLHYYLEFKESTSGSKNADFGFSQTELEGYPRFNHKIQGDRNIIAGTTPILFFNQRDAYNIDAVHDIRQDTGSNMTLDYTKCWLEMEIVFGAP